jgi:hypothetical protein
MTDFLFGCGNIRGIITKKSNANVNLNSLAVIEPVDGRRKKKKEKKKKGLTIARILRLPNYPHR